jgi:hypothetical protein
MPGGIDPHRKDDVRLASKAESDCSHRTLTMTFQLAN